MRDRTFSRVSMKKGANSPNPMIAPVALGSSDAANQAAMYALRVQSSRRVAPR
jgi:hypothetical protein